MEELENSGSFKKLPVDEQIMLLYRALAAHIGSNDVGAHLPMIPGRNDGFITAEQGTLLEMGRGLRQTSVDKNITSLWSLPAGKYEIPSDQFTDLPPGVSGAIVVDVSETTTNLKQIQLLNSWNNRLWYAKRHYTGAPSSWGAIKRYVPLWTGSVADVGATMKLSEPISNFTEIEIKFKCGALTRYQKFPVQDVFHVNGNKSYATSSDATVEFYECGMVHNNGTITIEYNKTSIHGGTSASTGGAMIRIYEIVGII